MPSCVCRSPTIWIEPRKKHSATILLRRPPSDVLLNLVPRSFNGIRVFKLRASLVDSSSESSSNFAKRIEQAWLISQQPTPVACETCNSKGNVECKWCAGTGFFVLGDNMLCEVPSRNTTCVICTGEGSIRCTDCQGTGFRAKWLGKPAVYKE
uniref:Uncharacterized protein n=1 Tax=Opuntia streptacantha TaxID=393608 RepID=A0A7C8YJQ6_OPUST